MMLDLNEYRKELLATIGEIAGVSADVVKGHQTLTGAGAKTGKLDAKTRELISLAVWLSPSPPAAMDALP